MIIKFDVVERINLVKRAPAFKIGESCKAMVTLGVDALRLLTYVTFLLFVSWPPPGHAATVDQAIAREVRERLLGLLTGGCITTDRGGPPTLAFYGVPTSDPHLFASERARLNNAALNGLVAADPRIEVRELEAAGDLAPIVGPGRTSSIDLAETLRRQSKADIVAVLTLARPTPQTARLSLTLHAGRNQSALDCNRRLTFGIGLSDLSERDLPLGDRDYLTLPGAFSQIISTFAPRLGNASAVALRSPHSLSNDRASCAPRRDLTDTFTDQYLSYTRGDGVNGVARSLPPLREARADAASSAPDSQLTILLSFLQDPLSSASSQPERQSLKVIATLARGRDVLLRRRIDVVLPQGSPPPCIKERCEETGDVAGLSVEPAEARTGDPLTIVAQVNRCEPTFFITSRSGRVTPLPLTAFSRRLTPDGGAHYELSPRIGPHHLAFERKDEAGRHTLGVYCSRCADRADPDRSKRMVGRVADAVRTGRTSGRLDNGTPFATTSIVKRPD